MVSVTVATSSVTYSVVGLPKNEGAKFGVEIDGSDIYRLEPSEEDSQILFRVDAPVAEESYRFVELNTDSDDVVDGEEFERDPIEFEINQVYGRSWTTQSVETFIDIHKRIGARKPDNLHPADEIPAVHIVANQEEIDRIHEHYNQNIVIKVDMTFIGYVCEEYTIMVLFNANFTNILLMYTVHMRLKNFPTSSSTFLAKILVSSQSPLMILRLQMTIISVVINL